MLSLLHSMQSAYSQVRHYLSLAGSQSSIQQRHSRQDSGGRACYGPVQQVDVDHKARKPQAQVQVQQGCPAVHGLSACPHRS